MSKKQPKKTTDILRNLPIGRSVTLVFKHRSTPLVLARQAGISLRTQLAKAQDTVGVRIKCTRIEGAK